MLGKDKICLTYLSVLPFYGGRHDPEVWGSSPASPKLAATR